MGVVTNISLQELNEIFPSYGFRSITPTLSGIIDTTYIVQTPKKSYILKKYERDIPRKINDDIELLRTLNAVGLNVPLCLDSNAGWYLYKKLEGSQPKNIKNYHIQALGRFLAKMHQEMAKTKCNSNARVEYEVKEALKYTKAHFFSYYKRFEFLKYLTYTNDTMIHADIFKDNTIFNGKKIGVIDFIDSTCGTLAFDVAVALVGFDASKKNDYFINIFLIAYNQLAPSKLTKDRVKEEMKIAAHFYALKRVYKYKNTFLAKELLV